MAGCIRSKIRYHHPRTSRRADDSRRNHLTSFTGKASPVCDNNGNVTTDEDKKGDGMDSIQFGSFARRRDATPHARRRKRPATAGHATVSDPQDGHDGPILRLVGFEQLEQLLIRGLGLYHGYAGHPGYFNVIKPNFAFAQQGLVCPWEHCIELCELPPMTKAEWEECLRSDRQRLASPDAAQLTESQVALIKARIAEGVPDRAPEEADEELEAKSCPMFGHACPGGATQARVCRQNEDGDSFEWANSKGE
jgi:hypothetical protein